MIQDSQAPHPEVPPLTLRQAEELIQRLTKGELDTNTRERSYAFLSREQVDLEQALELTGRATAYFSALEKTLRHLRWPHTPLPNGGYLGGGQQTNLHVRGMSEKKLREYVESRLDQLFHIRREVRGVCYPPTGGDPVSVRVDAVLIAREEVPLKQRHFAVEFKPEDRQDFDADMGKHITQAIDYRNTVWDEYGILPVLICPGMHQSIERVLGPIGVGSIKIRHDGYLDISFSCATIVCRNEVNETGKKWAAMGQGIGCRVHG